MKALVLAAGLGTRLRPLTLNRAKPSLPILGIPALWYGIWGLHRELGITEFAVNLSHAPQSIIEVAGDAELQKLTGVRFHFSDETDKILGSSGALWKLRDWIGGETLAVVNGDSICFPSWKKMLSFHRQHNSVLTMHVRSFENSREPYTNIELDVSGRVSKLGEKLNRGTMFSGSYLIEPELLARLPEGPSELRFSLLEPLILEGRLFACKEDVPWFDAGTMATYAETQFDLLKELPVVRQLVEMKMKEVSPNCWVPKTWKNIPLKLKAPVCLNGDLQRWQAVASEFGPRFIGIEPPPVNKNVVRANAIVLSEQSCGI
ncbi:MAG: sugar phosphate nucleotidyltransferase [Bdellovibrionota bacterium]